MASPRLIMTLLVAGSAMWSGCMTPQNTRFPMPHYRSTRAERAAAQIYDPFPDRHSGPDTGFRPRDFNQQRSDVFRSKQRSLLSGQMPGYNFPTNGAYSPSGYPPQYGASPQQSGYYQPNAGQPVNSGSMQYAPEARYPHVVPY